MTRITTKEKKPPKRPDDSLERELHQIKDTLVSFVTVMQNLASGTDGEPPRLETLSPQRTKRELKEELGVDIKAIEVHLARVEERLNSLSDTMDLVQRVSRLEEKFDLIIEEQLSTHFTFAPMDDEEEFDDFPEPGESDDDLDDPEEN